MPGNLLPASNVVYDSTTGAFKWYNPSTQAWALLEKAPTGNELTVGQETIPRTEVLAVTQAMSSGVERLTYFTARRSETATKVRTRTGTTAAGATPTLCRVGIYSVAANGDLALVGSTANGTSLWAASSTTYTTNLSAGVPLVEGTRYAVGLLCVTGATAPTLVSSLASLVASEAGVAPRLCGTRTGLTDLADPITAGTIGDTAVQMYAVLLP